MPVAPSSDSDKTSRPLGSAATTKKTDAVFKEYSKIKNFRFDIGGKWDDKNVCIFLPCYRETIKECSDYSKKNIDFWAKVAERGIASGGSRECFSSVNYCMELAERLKEFVQKYDKELEGVDAFDELKKDVSDLLPYFPPPEYDHIEKMKKPTPAFEGDNVELILKVSNDHLHRFGRVCVKYTAVFSAISKEVSSISGVQTDVKPILEKLKRDVIKTLSAEPDPQKRARMFPEIAKNFTIFDFVEPRDIKRKNYVPVETNIDLGKSKITLQGNNQSIESNGGLKSIEPPPSEPRQTDATEVDLSEVSSSTKLDREQGDSDQSECRSVEQMDVDDNQAVETAFVESVEPKRRPGRPKGALNKTFRRDASPIMTRGLRRSRENGQASGSESESNTNGLSVNPGKRMVPFVSIVRIPLQKQVVSTRQHRNGRAQNGASQLQRKDSHVSVARRQKKTGTEFDFARPYNNGSRASPIGRARRSFSPGNGSDGSSGSGRRKQQRVDKMNPLDFYNRTSSSLQLPHRSVEEEAAVPAHMPRSYHPSTYSARVNEPHCPIESGTPWSRSIVPRGRPRGSGYSGGGMETTMYRADRDVFGGSPDFSRELILKYEDLEKKKLVVIQKMHSEVVHEMKRTNDLLAMLLSSQK